MLVLAISKRKRNNEEGTMHNGNDNDNRTTRNAQWQCRAVSCYVHISNFQDAGFGYINIKYGNVHVRVCSCNMIMRMDMRRWR